MTPSSRIAGEDGDGGFVVHGGLGVDLFYGGGHLPLRQWRDRYRRAAGAIHGFEILFEDTVYAGDVIDLTSFDAEPLGTELEAFIYVGETAGPAAGEIGWRIEGGDIVIAGNAGADSFELRAGRRRRRHCRPRPSC